MVWPEAVGQQLLERELRPHLLRVGDQDRCLRTGEFPDLLTASATRRDQGVTLPDDQNGTYLGSTGQHHCAQGAGFGADTLRVGSVFDVASGMDPALTIEHGCTDMKMGIGRMGAWHGGRRGGKKRLALRIADAAVGVCCKMARYNGIDHGFQRSFRYGLPKAWGATVRPMKPASRITVSR